MVSKIFVQSFMAIGHLNPMLSNFSQVLTPGFGLEKIAVKAQ